MKCQRTKLIINLFITTLLLCSASHEIAFSQEDYFDPETLSFFPKESPSTTFHNSLDVNLSVGAAIYEYQLTLPPGRNGLVPHLALRYSTLNREHGSLVGYGWRFDTGHIIRSKRRGLPVFRPWAPYRFEVNLWGEEIELKQINAEEREDYYGFGIYGAKNETDFKRYEWKGDGSDENYWYGTDTEGVTYVFGETAQARQRNPHLPQDKGSSMFLWMLERIVDPHGNQVTFTYTDEFAPLEINYTGAGAQAGPITIRFLYTDRDAPFEEASAGFLRKTTKVLTRIEVYVDGDLRRAYELTYLHPSDGTKISLLSSIKETAWNGNGEKTESPPRTFGYAMPGQGWKASGSYSGWYPSSTDEYNYWVFGDFTGNGLPDIIANQQIKRGDNVENHMDFYRNTGSGWERDETWDFGSTPSFKKSTKFADMNGDMKLDVIMPYESHIYMNTGNGFEKIDGWNLPNYHELASIFLELNGDGLSDVIINGNEPQGGGAWINTNGKHVIGFAAVPTPYTNPLDLLDVGTRFGDLNGDGLTDIIRYESDRFADEEYEVVYLHNGDGWTEVTDGRWEPPSPFFVRLGRKEYRTQGTLIDINNDGFADAVMYNLSDGSGFHTSKVYINDGVGHFIESGVWKLDLYAHEVHYPYQIDFTDVNKDGAVDYVQHRSWSIDEDSFLEIPIVALNKGNGTRHYLTHIDNGMGYSLGIKYSKPDLSETQDLPFPVHVVSSITATVSAGDKTQTTTKRYTYKNGHYYFDLNDMFERAFSGFHVVEIEVGPLDNPKIHRYYFHQSQSSVDGSEQGEFADHVDKKGRPYRHERWEKDSNGDLTKLEETINKWTRRVFDDGRRFIFLEQTLERTFGEDGTLRERAVRYEYDDYGNVVKQIEFGEVQGNDDGTFSNIGDDTRMTKTRYAVDVGGENNIVSLPSEQIVYDYDGVTPVQQSLYYYDDLPIEQVTQGNLTTEKRWLNTDNSYIDRTLTYDSYGLVTSKTDFRGNQTIYNYGSRNMYPETIENALGHQTHFEYDYATGQVKREIHSNGFVVEREYDGFGRPLLVKGSDANDPSVLVIREKYTYDDFANPHLVHKEEYLSSSAGPKETFIYRDGLNRVIQTRTSTDTVGEFRVTTIEYDDFGRVAKEYLPFIDTSPLYQPTLQPDGQATWYTYDTLDRVTRIENAVGKTTLAYSDWKTTMVDPNKHKVIRHFDAYGRLIQVDERDGRKTYHTIYQYDAQGNLIFLDDADRNIRGFTYDSLGRQITNELPHQVGAEAAVYVYQYDENGNKIREVQPNGTEILWIYDTLNRILTIDTPTTAEGDVAYTYDIAPNGIGRIARVATQGVTKDYEYTIDGQIAKETQTFIGTTNAPEIDITQAGSGVYNGDIFAFGAYPAGAFVEMTFQVENVGTEVLELTGIPPVAITGAYSDQFSVVTFPETLLDPGTSTTFTIAFAPTSTGEKNATLTLPNTDPDEQTYVIHLRGVGTTSLYTYTLINPASAGVPQILISLGDANEIRFSTGQTYTLGKNQGIVIPGAEAVDGLTIYATAPLTVYDTVHGTEGFILHTHKGRAFVFSNMRGSHRFYMMAPDADADVTVEKVGKSVEALIAPRGEVEPYIAGSYRGSATIITSNADLLVFHTTGNSEEAVNLYPATTEPLYGIATRHYWISAIEDNTNVEITASSGESITFTLHRGERVKNPLDGVGNSQGRGAGLRIVGDKPIAAYQHSDGDGTEATAFLPEREFITDTTIPTDAQYLAVVTMHPHTRVDLLEPVTGEVIESLVSGPTTLDTLHFGSSRKGVHIPVGTIVHADQPVYAIYEHSAMSAERNLYGATMITDTISQLPQGIGAMRLNRAANANTSGSQGEGVYHTHYFYDSHSALIAIQYPDGSLVEYQYNPIGKVSRILRNGTLVVSDIFYAPTEAIESISYANGLTTRYSYALNQLYRLTNQTTERSGEILQNIDYTYDPLGNITQILDTGTVTPKNAHYSYDELARLTHAEIFADGETIVEDYTYSRCGNILSKNGVNYLYNDPRHPHAVTHVGSDTYAYDENGNLRTENRNGEPITYAYDYRNRLTSVTNQSGTNIYVYGQGYERIRKIRPDGSMLTYLGELAEVDESGSFTNYVFSASMRVATVGNGLHYTTSDHLSSASFITDTAGTVVQRLDYLPFGEEWINEKTGPFDTRFTYTDQEKDRESGLMYYGARFYHPGICRFTQVDPVVIDTSRREFALALLNPQLLNGYSYVGNNPMRYIDPTGEGAIDTLGSFFEGFNYVLYDSVLGGIPSKFVPPPPDNKASRIGQAVGAGGAVIVGIAETAVGAHTFIGGIGTQTVITTGSTVATGLQVVVINGTAIMTGTALTSHGTIVLQQTLSDSNTSSPRTQGKTQVQGRRNNDFLSRTADDVIKKDRVGSINREFPGELRDKTLGEIKALTKQQGDLGRKAKKAWKLLNDGRFKKKD